MNTNSTDEADPRQCERCGETITGGIYSLGQYLFLCEECAHTLHDDDDGWTRGTEPDDARDKEIADELIDRAEASLPTAG